MKPSHHHGIRRIIRATRFSFQGLTAAFKHEAAFREEIILAVILSPIIIWLNVPILDKLLLTLSLALILITELMNSAIEAVVDRISDEIHPLSGRAKDIGSAAVFIALCFAAITWGCIILPLLF